MSLSPSTFRTLRYAGGLLDRVSAQRTDGEWVKQQAELESSVVVPVAQTLNLFALDGKHGSLAYPILPAVEALRTHLQTNAELLLLGVRESVTFFAVDLSMPEQRAVAAQFDGQFADLRTLGMALPASDAALLAYARGLAHWHRAHSYCGSCGERTQSQHGGHMRRCATCQLENFPRIDSAVIMLVEAENPRGEPICLLGTHSRLPAGVYSTLAGFVEPGESIEQTVVREVWEEAGVVVDSVAYRGSQPWPFPASLMLGFRAHAASTTISLLDNELDEAAWFTPRQLSCFGEWSDEGASHRLPRRDSIARVLIDEWLAEHPC